MLLAHLTAGDVPGIVALCAAAFAFGIGWAWGKYARR